MGDFRSHLFPDRTAPLFQLLFLMIVLVCGVLLFSLTVIAGRYIFEIDPSSFNILDSSPGPNDAAFLKYTLVMQQISLFIIPSLLLMTIINLPPESGFSDLRSPALNEIILVILLAFCIFPITSFTGLLNSQVTFPDWLSGLENWMIEKEESAERVIQTITTPDKISTFIGNIMIIAILPSLGEELIFRGVIQKILSRLTKSGNVSVWITAFIFSSLHLQFFGFLPRFILGLIYGYLFLWSGTLWLPILAHFVNNAVSVSADFFQSVNPSEALPDSGVFQLIGGIILPVFVVLLIMLYFRQRKKQVPEYKPKDNLTNE